MREDPEQPAGVGQQAHDLCEGTARALRNQPRQELADMNENAMTKDPYRNKPPITFRWLAADDEGTDDAEHGEGDHERQLPADDLVVDDDQ